MHPNPSLEVSGLRTGPSWLPIHAEHTFTGVCHWPKKALAKHGPSIHMTCACSQHQLGVVPLLAGLPVEKRVQHNFRRYLSITIRDGGNLSWIHGFNTRLVMCTPTTRRSLRPFQISAHFLHAFSEDLWNNISCITCNIAAIDLRLTHLSPSDRTDSHIKGWRVFVE
jgi:hypothetical protein